MTAGGHRTPCPRCGSNRSPLRVHGQARCPACGADLAACCDGAAPADEAAPSGQDGLRFAEDLFSRLFARLGGLGATVTREALRFALAEHQSTDLETADLLLEAAERTRTIERAVCGGYRLHRDD